MTATLPLLLINPNTNGATTRRMVAIAGSAMPDGQTVEGATARWGAPLIDDDAKLAASADAALELAASMELSRYLGVIVAAFGDPGLEALKAASPVPVTGIAEAGMIEAAAGGRRFSIVTTTPQLAKAIHCKVVDYGFGDLFAGLQLTEGEPAELMRDPEQLEARLALACETAVSNDGAEALIIGGGPLASAAASLRGRFSVPIVEPVPAAARLALTRAAMAGVGAL
ncbi:aspartate/glutamate racemase family protein [Arthrobacter cupressi]